MTKKLADNFKGLGLELLSFTLENRTSIILSVFNMTGKVIYTEHYYPSGGAEIARIDVSSLADGAYILQMTNTTGSRAQHMFVK